MKKIILSFLCLASAVNAQAMGAKPLPGGAVNDLLKAQVRCNVSHIKIVRDDQLIKDVEVSKNTLTTNEANKGEKCLNIAAPNGPENVPYGCIPVTADTAKAFDKTSLILDQDMGYGNRNFTIDLVNGTGSFSVKASGGWEKKTDIVELTLDSCVLTK